MSAMPKLIVFDLDGCVWEPEMYELWGGGAPFSYNPKNGDLIDSRQRGVYLLGDVRDIMYQIKTGEEFKDSIIAIASSCDEPSWADECLRKFRIGPNLDVELKTVFSQSEIYKVQSGLPPGFFGLLLISVKPI